MVQRWQLPVVALAGAGIALLLSFTSVWVPLRVLAMGVGLLAAGSAVAIRPKDRIALSAAILVALLSAWGMNGSLVQSWFYQPGDDWDSARLVLYVLAAVATLALFLVSLPQIMGNAFLAWEHTFSSPRANDLKAAEERGQTTGRGLARAIVSLLAVLHFIGIGAAVMSVQPTPDREPSWLASHIIDKYQHYLEFTYLTNAYRFYSPEPGPPSLVWFRVEYADDSYRWIKLPTRGEDAKDPLGVEFTRRLSIGNSAGQVQFVGDVSTEMRQRRIGAGMPIHAEFPLGAQYRPPQEGSRRYLREFARHVAQEYPHEKADIGVTGVKVYVVIHQILYPRQMADEQIKPDAPWTYLPYYMGDFTKDGELKDPDDPLLYWLIPTTYARNPLAKFDSEKPDVEMDYKLLEEHGRTKTQSRKH
jgi:hypothetical protein